MRPFLHFQVTSSPSGSPVRRRRACLGNRRRGAGGRRALVAAHGSTRSPLRNRDLRCSSTPLYPTSGFGTEPNSRAEMLSSWHLLQPVSVTGKNRKHIKSATEKRYCCLGNLTGKRNHPDSRDRTNPNASLAKSSGEAPGAARVLPTMRLRHQHKQGHGCTPGTPTASLQTSSLFLGYIFQV